MTANGKIGDIYFRGIKLEPNLCACTLEIDDESVKKFDETLKKINILVCQKKLKEKLLSKMLMKLVRKEINKIETCKQIIILNQFNENEVMVIDKSKFELKPEVLAYDSK